MPFSFLRLARKVDPSPSLEELLARARTLAKRAFDVKKQYWVNVPDFGGDPDVKRMLDFEGAVDLNAIVFPVNSLRVTLLAKRAQAAADVNETLRKAYNRVTASEIPTGRTKRAPSGRKISAPRRNTLPQALKAIERAAGVQPGERLPWRAESVSSRRFEGETPGTIYYLNISASTPAGIVLPRQSETAQDTMRRMRVCKPLFTTAFETSAEPLRIPFATVPNGAPEDHARYLEALNEDCYVESTLRQPVWKPEIVEPE